MGAVYRATDTKLNRDVAIKVLPTTFAADADHMARFTREAQVLASLNHPNIAAIYGVEERALVLELVEGPTLADRIARGALPIEEALPIAVQIAEALEYAHEKGIIHRDLKPANIKITPEGRVKVLDFGLAKALSVEAAPGDPAASPTLTMRATMAGAIMGTAAYMSPEQARGQNVDRRADIWAFGVVLYEMLTGRMLFGGPTISDTLASVLKADLDLTPLDSRVRPVLDRCLRKDVRTRWQAIGDVRVALDESTHAPAAPVVLAPSRGPVPWIVAAVLGAAALIAAGGWWTAMRRVSRPLVRLSTDLGRDAILSPTNTATLSPDGSRIIFVARVGSGSQLAAQSVDEAKSSLIPGTDNGSDPFFSPDGEWIGFFAAGKMKKVSSRGGGLVTLCDAPAARGASWADDGSIVATLTTTSGLVRVPSAGGAPAAITRPEEFHETTHRWPQVLPGSQSVLFTTHTGFDMDNASIDVLTFATGKRKRLVKNGYFARYLPTGHLVYVHQNTLFGVRFDLKRLEVTGAPVPLLEELASNSTFGSGQFSFSQSGAFLFQAGAGSSLPLVWMDQAGKTEPLITLPGFFLTPRISPDGSRIALIGFEASRGDIWVYDIQRQTPQRLTFGNASGFLFPVWTPDGKHLIYGSQGDSYALWWRRADGGGEPVKLIEEKATIRPYSVSPDGRTLAYHALNGTNALDIYTMALDLTDPDRPKPGTPQTFLGTPAMERYPAFSPDGRWIAYNSTESGTDEIYVRPYPGPGGRWQISTAGGQFPFWSRNRHELYFENAANQIMVAEYTAKGDTFQPGIPRIWNSQQLSATGSVPSIDLAPDGKRFAVVPSSISQGNVHVTFLLNFFDELRRKLP
jgi:serine/threonine-protein kinase